MKVTVEGVPQVQRLVKELAPAVTRGVAAHLHKDEVVPLAADMRARAARYGRIGARAASTIVVAPTTDGARLEVGGASSTDLGSVLFAGSEYGGRIRKRTYSRRNRGGSGAHPVTRKTTQMFLPHLGRRGYWFWPTMRADLKGIIGRVSKTVSDVIDDV